MKVAIHQIYSNTTYTKIIHWVKLIAMTGGAQAVVQVTGLLSGILIIRLLPVQEYAYYTIANTMLGTMTLLADGGISTGVMAQGGKVWQDKEKFGAVLATGLDLRRKFAVVSLIVSIPILLYLLIHQGASWLTSMLIVLALIPAFYAALSDSLFEIVPKLHQDIKPLQTNQISVSISRLLLSGLALLIFPWTFISLLANGIPRIYGNVKLRKLAESYTDKGQKPNMIIRNEILKNVKRIIPSLTYYCLSGQIAIWLISIFGTTTSIAQIGALGRLSVLLNFFSILVSILLVPKFAKLALEKIILLKYFGVTILVCIMISILIVIFTIIFPAQILWILGKEYANLGDELILNILISCISFIAGIAYTIFTNRGWSINPFFAVISSFFSIVVGAVIFNLSTLEGILYFSLFTSVFQLILNVSFGLFRILKLP